MCGISGIVELSSFQRDVLETNINKMTDFMYHRGPDGRGIFIHQNIALGHRRLSIIDLAGGAQPLRSHCGRYVITFNGEIYNYIELRRELQEKGYQFKTLSDTEVLLYALIAYGPDVIARLNGMFAFCFVDTHHKKLILARDHMGIKPLYYYKDNHRLLFASDLGALACYNQFPRAINAKAISHYFSWRVIPNPYTAYDNTLQVEPGHYIKFDLDTQQLTVTQYWDIPLHKVTPRANPKMLVEELSALLADALKLQIRSDVKVGTFLSGGVDSSTIAYWVAQLVSNPLTFTVGFAEKQFDESAWALDVAQKLETDHHTEMITNYELDKEFQKIIYYFNQPNGTGIPNYFVSGLGRKHAKVALSGVGGDELFAGYSRFNFGINNHSYEYDFLRSLMSFTNDDKSQFFTSSFNAATQDESSLHFILNKYANKTTEEAINKLCYLDLKHFMLNDLLLNLDKMSMAHSLEVRVPLLDFRLVEFAMSVPPELKINSHIQKYLLKRTMYHKLPNHVFLRRKKGFSLPKQFWIKKMRDFILDVMNPRTLSAHGVLNCSAVNNYVEKTLKQETISWRDANNIWNMFTFELWMSMFVDKQPEIINYQTNQSLMMS